MLPTKSTCDLEQQETDLYAWKCEMGRTPHPTFPPLKGDSSKVPLLCWQRSRDGFQNNPEREDVLPAQLLQPLLLTMWAQTQLGLATPCVRQSKDRIQKGTDLCFSGACVGRGPPVLGVLSIEIFTNIMKCGARFLRGSCLLAEVFFSVPQHFCACYDSCNLLT